MSIEIRPLPRSDIGRATNMLADAFIDDPLTLAVSPKGTAARRFTLKCFHLSELVIAFLRRGYVYGGYVDGRLCGAVIAYANGSKFPFWAWLVRAPASIPSLVLAGPRASALGVKILNDIEKIRPKEPYVHFWQVGAEAGTRGLGVSLLRKVLTDHVDPARRNAYLEAAGPHLTELYGLLGFVVQEEYELPSGEKLITMWRPAVEVRP